MGTPRAQAVIVLKEHVARLALHLGACRLWPPSTMAKQKQPQALGAGWALESTARHETCLPVSSAHVEVREAVRRVVGEELLIELFHGDVELCRRHLRLNMESIERDIGGGRGWEWGVTGVGLGGVAVWHLATLSFRAHQSLKRLSTAVVFQPLCSPCLRCTRAYRCREHPPPSEHLPVFVVRVSPLPRLGSPFGSALL